MNSILFIHPWSNEVGIVFDGCPVHSLLCCFFFAFGCSATVAQTYTGFPTAEKPMGDDISHVESPIAGSSAGATKLPKRMWHNIIIYVDLSDTFERIHIIFALCACDFA